MTQQLMARFFKRNAQFVQKNDLLTFDGFQTKPFSKS